MYEECESLQDRSGEPDVVMDNQLSSVKSRPLENDDRPSISEFSIARI